MKRICQNCNCFECRLGCEGKCTNCMECDGFSNHIYMGECERIKDEEID